VPEMPDAGGTSLGAASADVDGVAPSQAMTLGLATGLGDVWSRLWCTRECYPR
jgi:hypothetical protein